MSTRRLSPRFHTRYTSLGHILDTRGTAGGTEVTEVLSQRPHPRLPGAKQSLLTPAGELPLHLHVEIGGLRETRALVRDLPSARGQWAWRALCPKSLF